MASQIAILDGNCYLHSGEASWSKNMSFMGFPTGGIYQLVSKIVYLASNNIGVVVVFDSPSFRKDVNSDYKKSRKVDYKILAQANAVIPCLRRAGINVLQVPEFEGDDLIANVIKANPNYEFVIYTCDYDAAINVTQRVRVTGCKSGFPTINNRNFSDVLREEHEIPYNTYGMYKVIFGCSSDEIQSIGDEAEAVWSMFIKMFERDYGSKGKALIVSENYCRKFLEAVRPYFTAGTLLKFEENITLVFPRILTPQEIADNAIDLSNFSNMDISGMADTCHIFGLKKCYKMVTNDEDVYELSDKEKEWILRRAKDYKLRGDAVDAEIDINAKARFNSGDIDENIDSSTDFGKVANGMNVGLF